MKKHYLGMMSFAALAMALGSCQMQESGSGNLKGEVDFSISAGIPGEITTYSPEDGTAFSHNGGASNIKADAYDLRYILEIYDGEALAYRDEKVVKENFTAEGVTFNARLLAKKYDVVLWADFVKEVEADVQASDLYYATSALKNIQYTSEVSITPGILATDAADAYYTSFEMNLTESSQSMKDVKLRRPFGKMRFIATDKLSDGVNQSERPASVIMDFGGAEVPSSFNALTGEASGSLDIEELAFSAVKEDAWVNDDTKSGAYLLGYTYFFATNPMSAYEVGITVTSDMAEQIGNRNLSGIPVQENKLTTVIGNFYTNKGSIEVIVEDKFDTEIVYSKWDGEKESPVIDEENKKVRILTANQMAGFADMVNSGTNDFAEYTVTLESDLDLNGKEWIPVGNGGRSQSNPTGPTFKGVFDGNGKTIENLVIKGEYTADQAVGFFGVVDGGEVKNITFKNVDIDVPGNEMAAAAVGMLTGGGTVSGIDVYGKISATRGNGAVVGRLTKNGTIKDCNNHAEILGTDSNVGGIVGAAYYTSNDGRMLIENCTNYGSVKGTKSVGGIVGLSTAEVVKCVNESDMTGNGECVGGIVADQRNAGSIKGCVNNGNIENNSNSYATGGIVGWVRYIIDETAYPRMNVIEITDNVNKGSVTGGNDAGGIAGVVYNNAVVDRNENYAPSLTAKTFAAGIVGNAQFTVDLQGKFGGNMVYVRNNRTTTPYSMITVGGSCKDLFVYINNPDYVTVENNIGPAFPETGAGTADNPKIISSVDDLRAFAAMVNSGNDFNGVFIKLSSDIDLNRIEWIPVGSAANPFKGTFDGDGKKVSNLKITASEDDAGLFGTLMKPGKISNLTVENAEVAGHARVGALIGDANTGNIENCHAKGNLRISGNYKVGGLIGQGYSSIRNCSVIGNAGSTVTATFERTDYEGDNVGGLIGFTVQNTKGHENWSVSNIAVSGTRKVGGAMGYLHFGVEINNVTVSGVQVSSNASESYILENASRMFVGGIVGEYSALYADKLPQITGSISSSTVSGPSAGVRIGGSRQADFENRQSVLSGLTKDESSVAVSMWYGERNPKNIFVDRTNKQVVVTDPAALAALTEYLSAFQENVDYYQWGWSIVLDEDISVFDLQNLEWAPLKVHDFKGFDGNNVTIRNFVVNALPEQQAGFFSSFTHNSSDVIDPIRNLVVEKAIINGPAKGNGGTAGVIVGGTDFTLKNCTVRNSAVKGGNYTGGLVGYSYGDFIGCSISMTTVTGVRKDAGALVGFLNESRTITDNRIGAGTVVRMAEGSDEQNIGWIAGRWNYPNGGGFDKPSTISGNTKDPSVSVTEPVGKYVNEN